jgi:signal transduction histidine kinase
LNIQKKELEFEATLNKVQLKSIEDERRKLGSILHDDLGQLLTLIHMQLSELKKNDRDNSSLKMIEDLCNTASERCSSISKMLFPASLIRLGFIEGLHELISDMQLGYISYLNTIILTYPMTDPAICFGYSKSC